MKRCRRCKIEKLLDAFNKGQKWCRDCQKEYRTLNREKVLEYARTYYREHQQQLIAYARNRFRAYRDELLEDLRRYWKGDRHEQNKQTVRDYHRKNRRKVYGTSRKHHMRQDAIRRMAKSSPEAEVIDPMEVFSRDYGICQLCGEIVDPSLKWPDSMSASIDHITPIACGGQHTHNNVQLAHLICNIRKGATKCV